jgi:hypothetical protein
MCHIQVARLLVPCGNGCYSAFLVHYSRNQIYWSELDKPCVTETKRTRSRKLRGDGRGGWRIGYVEGMEGEGRDRVGRVTGLDGDAARRGEAGR